MTRFAAFYAAAVVMLLVFGCMAAVHAESRIEWAGYLDGPPFVIEASPGTDGALATVTITNQMVPNWMVPRSVVVSAGDVQITVEVRQAQGDAPDTITVIPPTGYAAVPGRAVLQEGETVVISIVEALSS